MTRTLWKFLLILMMTSMIGGCSLFGGDDQAAGADVDTESVSSSEVVLDAENEMLAESEDLAEDADVAEASLDGEEADFGDDAASDDSLDEEFETAGLDDAGDDGDDEFSDDDFDDQPESQFSQTDDNNVDPELAEDEFADFDDEGEGEQDQFALEDDPVIDEMDQGDPIVDVPADDPVMAAGGNQVKNLEYKAFENGGTVVIETTSPANYQKFVDPDLNQVVIQVDDVFLPERFKRPYVTKDFKQDIATINAYTDETGAARFVIQMKRPVEPAVQKEGNSILVMTTAAPMMKQASAAGADAEDPLDDPGPNEESLDSLVANNQMTVPPGVSPGVSAAGGAAAAGSMTVRASNPGGQTVATLGNAGTANNKGATLGKSFGGAEKSGLTLNPIAFSGEKINLEYINEDVRAIIQDITNRSGVNLIMDKEVEGTTSIRLRNVPWDQALLVLLRSEGLGYVKQGTVLRIAKQSTLSKEAQAVSAQIKSEKQAQLLSGGIKVKYIPVSYAKVNELATKLKSFTSKEGKIAFDDRTSSLVITDYGEYIERIQDLVAALDTPPMQVEIESKLVEAREDFIREVGINWDINGQEFPIGQRTGQLNAALTQANASTEGFSLDLSVGTFDIFGDLTASLNVFESTNKIKVLSQPRVVTMNKVEANIEQTTQIPISTTTITPGAPAIQQFEFVDLTLALKVTPQITFKGDVILDVELKREFAGARNVDGSRELNKRKAKSTVMVKNGKTAVIGGIYQLDDGDLEGGVPLLKDIPLIGYLFKQIRTEKIKNELLLFLKPKIIREVDGPMVSKSGAPGANYDPFEELTVDEGGVEEQVEGPSEEEFDEGEDDIELEDELEGFEDV